MFICKTPLRISFLGGGTDFPSWYNQKKGLVLATSIDKYTHLQARYLPEVFNYKFKFRIRYFKNEEVRNIDQINHPVYKSIINFLDLSNSSLEIIHNTDLPALSGMGSSSSNTVATLNVLNRLKKKKLSKQQLAKDAIKVEQEILNEFVGSQDQIITAFGGFNAIEFTKNKFTVRPIKNSNNIKKLENSIVLIFSGLTRFAQKIEKNKMKKMEQNEKVYDEMLSITQEGVNLINSKSFSLKKFGSLIAHSWELKKELSKDVTNKHINEMYNKGLKLGAYGGKLLGAGSGGFLLFICNNKVKKKIQDNFKNHYIIPIKFENDGTKIIYEN